MNDMIGWGAGLALIGLIVWATVAIAGRVASRRRGGMQMMAAMLFGFGAALDPPQRHVAEAKDETPKGSPESGEPELDP
jgi:drug/metabolite transporter (DMT)-like permease